MTLDQVIEMLNSYLQSENWTGVTSLTEAALFSVARDVWIEHQALPELAVTYIIDRRMTGEIGDHERDFWRRYGLEAT